MSYVTRKIALMLLLLFVFGACAQDSPESSSIPVVSTEETGADAATEATTEAVTEQSGPDLSEVRLTIASAGWVSARGAIDPAGLNDYEYDVEVFIMPGGNLALEAMAAGQVNFGASSQIPPIFVSQAENGGNFRIIATRRASVINQELLAGPGTGITTVEELAGKRVGYVRATTAHYFLFRMLEEVGLSWDDIEPITLTPADGLTALITGDIDAFATFGNTVVAAREHGATTLRTADGILSGDFYYVATPEAIADENTRAAIVDYLRRFHEAAAWSRDNPVPYAEWLADITNQEFEPVYRDIIDGEAHTPTRVVPLNEATIASTQGIADVFADLGVLDQRIDVSGLFDFSISDAVAEFEG